MNPGKCFEQQFRASAPPSSYLIRLNDPAQSFSNPESLRFSPNNPFDYAIFSSPYLFTLELKSTIGSLSFFTDDSPTRSVNIKRCQINGLEKAAQHTNVVAGFIFNFRESESTYFLPIKAFLEFRSTCGKKSINEKDVIALGSYKIKQEKIRTKYRYDIETFLNSAQMFL